MQEFELTTKLSRKRADGILQSAFLLQLEPAIIVFTALAVGALSLRGSTEAQLAVEALAIESDAVNCTYLMD